MVGKDPALENAFSRVHRHISDVEKELGNAKASIGESAKQKDIENIRKRLDDLNERIRPLHSELSLIEEVRAKLAKVESDSTRRAEYLDLYTAVAKVQKELTKRDDLKKHILQIDRLGAKLETAEKKTDNLDKELANIKSTKADNESMNLLKEDIDKKKVSIEELNKGFKDLEKDLLLDIKEESEEIRKDILKLSKALSMQDKDMDGLFSMHKDLESKAYKITDAKKELSQFEKEQEKLLKEKIKDIGKEIEKLKGNDSLVKKIPSIETGLSEHRKDISKRITDLQVLLEKGLKERVSHKDINLIRDDLVEKSVAIRKDITSKEGVVKKEFKSEIGKLSKEFVILQSEFDDLEKDLKARIESSGEDLVEMIGEKADSKSLKDITQSLQIKEISIRKEITLQNQKTAKELSSLRDEIGKRLEELRKDSAVAIESKKQVEILDTTFQRALLDLNRHEKMIKEMDDSLHSQTKSFDMVNTRLKSMVADYDKNLLLVETKIRAHADVAIKSEMIRFGRTIESLKSEIMMQRKLIKDKAELEKRLKAYRDERIERWRTIVLSLFLGIGAFTALVYYYGSRNPLAFPGLGPKLLFIVGTLGVLLFLTFLNYDKILPMIDSFFFRKAEKKIGSKTEKDVPLEIPEKISAKTQAGTASKKTLFQDGKAVPKKSEKAKKGFLDRIVDFFDED